MKKYTIFDNKGETLDRYTVIDREGEMLGLSEEPTSPLGFSQFSGNCVDNYMMVTFGAGWRRTCNVKKVISYELPRIIEEFKSEGNLGVEIPFSSLPKELKDHLKMRFETYC